MDIVLLIGVVGVILALGQLYYSRMQVKQNSIQLKLQDNKLLASSNSNKAKLHLKIITDPRFIDSAIFMWILHNQPFESLGIYCELIKTDWRSIPEQVASHQHAIGFYNRKSILQHHNQPIYNFRVWNDLCLYKGYALLARKGSKLSSPVSLSAANKYICDLIQQYKGENKKPILICMGADSIWKMNTPFTPEFKLDEFEVEIFNNPDFALKKFLDGHGDLFIGGLPQRLVGREHGCIEVLTFQNNPLLFSINSLICSEEIFQTEKNILALVTALWFDAVCHLKRDSGFCNKVAKECIQLNEELGVVGSSLRESFFCQIFISEANEFECFPEQPSGIINEVLDILDKITKQLGGVTIRKILIHQILEQMNEILKPQLDKEKYPSIMF